jgi:putative endonuclease
MSGRLTQFALRRLDAAIRLTGREPDGPAHLETGRRGEEEAYFHLRAQGYVMVARNWRSPRRHGEIDLIGWDGDVLCFVEVKTRTTREVKPAESAVDREKQRQIVGVAREYLRRLGGSPQHRFDILSIYMEGGGRSPDMILFKNAFRVS